MDGLKKGIPGTGTTKLILKYEVTTVHTVTYAWFVCDYNPQKEEIHRTRITVGVDPINYPGNVTTRGADMKTIKLFLNSVVSTPDARFITAYIKNFCLNTEMERPEYMKIKINSALEEGPVLQARRL